MPSESVSKSPAELIAELRSYQAELEAQNQALQYSRIAAEGASERFESLFSKVPLALMVVDELGMIVQSNAMALQKFRPHEHDAPLNFLLPLIAADHVQRVEDSFWMARQTGSSETTEVVFLRGSEGTLTGDLHMARIEYSQDEMAHFICAVIDQGPLLAERQALQQSAEALSRSNEGLRLSENRLAAIINSSLDAILCVDSHLNITVFNPAAAQLFECPPDQALGTSLKRFLPDALQAIAAVVPSAHAQLGEVRGCSAAGKVLDLEVSVSCELDAQGRLTTVFARDLTARKAMENKLRESQKMQAVGTMAGGIAHDFNNILGAILGNVNLAMQDAGPDSPAQVSLREIDKAGRRARELVRQILAFSRNELPQRSPVRLADLVEDTLRLLSVTLPPHVSLSTEVAPDTPDVLADPTQVEQALLNLCTNAIQAMPGPHATLKVMLHKAPLDAQQAQGLGLTPGLYASVSVEDTGEGMAPETLQRIFEPFFTTKQVGQGTGLGLAVVHGVMRAHAGAVDVQSTPGKGSRFTLYFPAMAEPTTLPESVPEVAAPSVAARGHVMYVDDDQALVFLVQRVLTRRGLTVSCFNDPLEALDALRADPMAFDLLLTDYNMPGYSGVDLLRAASAVRGDLPMALASGYVTPEVERDALAAGARTLIHKPNDVDEICAAVVDLLQQAHPAAGRTGNEPAG